MSDFKPAVPVARKDAAFDAYRRELVWQAMKPDRFPHMIWPVHSEADIIDALAYARAENLKASIVSGGHSYIGHGIQDGCLVIDLSRLKGMAIDVDRKSGWIEPGVRVSKFDRLLATGGLSFPIGHDPNVGLVGYLLGGGIGWNPEGWNSMACFNVTAAEIILASGEKIIADADHHTDLFWAVRGAGPNFCGIVTRLHIQLFPRPKAIYKSEYIFAFDMRESVFTWLERMHGSLDSRLELSLMFAIDPERDEAGGLQNRCLVSFICFADTATEASSLCEPFHQTAPNHGLLSKREFVPTTFDVLLSETKGDATLRRTVESIWTDDAYAAARAAADAFLTASSADNVIYIGLRKNCKPPIDTACSILGKGFIFVDAAWREERDDLFNEDWVDEVIEKLRPYDKGGYINETNWHRRPERIARCYSPDALKTLTEINKIYDPFELFLKPSGSHGEAGFAER